MSPLLARIHHGFGDGVVVTDGARPFLVGNEIWGNGEGGIFVRRGADPFLSVNIIRDHAGRGGIGVLVAADAPGNAMVLPDNAFLRNEGGDVVRDPPPADHPGARSDRGGAEHSAAPPDPPGGGPTAGHSAGRGSIHPGPSQSQDPQSHPMEEDMDLDAAGGAAPAHHEDLHAPGGGGAGHAAGGLDQLAIVAQVALENLAIVAHLVDDLIDYLVSNIYILGWGGGHSRWCRLSVEIADIRRRPRSRRISARIRLPA